MHSMMWFIVILFIVCIGMFALGKYIAPEINLASRYEGTLVDQTGNPVANQTVTRKIDPEMSTVDPIIQTVQTDTAGHVTFDPVFIRSWFALLPHEPNVSIDVTTQYGELEKVLLNIQKSSYQEGSERAKLFQNQFPDTTLADALIKTGSTLNITCNIDAEPDPEKYIYWSTCTLQE